MLVTALLAGVAGAALAAAPAWAHDELVTTAPAAGQTVAAVPADVVLTFAEPPLALGLAVQVTGPDGTDLAAGKPALVGSTVHQAVRAGAPAGRYTVHWRVTADDGHPVTGSFAFVARASGGEPTAAAPTPAPPVDGVANSQDPSYVLWWTAATIGVALVAGTAALTTVRRRNRVGAEHAQEGALDD